MVLADLKKSLEGTDIEDIKKKTQSLIQVSMKLGEAVYKSQQNLMIMTKVLVTTKH